MESKIKMFGLIGVVVIVLLLFTVVVYKAVKIGGQEVGVVSGTTEKEDGVSSIEDIADLDLTVITEEDIEVGKQVAEHGESMEITEQESETILVNRETEYVNPRATSDRLYVFYDRNKIGSLGLLELVEEYVKKTGIDYTIYHMQQEDGLVNGVIVLEELGYEYDLRDEDSVVLVLVKDYEVKTVMTVDTLSEDELYREGD